MTDSATSEEIATLDCHDLEHVSGGFTPMTAALFAMGAPVRAMGMFMPRTTRMLGAAAQARHDLWTNAVHPGSQMWKGLHNNYVRAFYGPFAPR